jgi:hypothetical protein
MKAYFVQFQKKKKKRVKKMLTAIGAGFPGTFTAHGSPARNEGKPSAGTLIPGNIKSAPPMRNRETSPPFSMKVGKSSGTFQRAKTASSKTSIFSRVFQKAFYRFYHFYITLLQFISTDW